MELQNSKGLQLIFVVEADKTCKSDWKYIKETIDRFYFYDKAHVKLNVVYMGGKGNYQNKDVDVKTLIKQYGASRRSKYGNEEYLSVVIYCIDCDDYDTSPEDKRTLESVQQFCQQHGYEFLWFCKDIERVFWGKKIQPKQKKKEADDFVSKKVIAKVNDENLQAKKYKANSSNILVILDGISKRKGISPLFHRKNQQ